MQLVQLSSYSFIDLVSFEIELLNEIRPTRKGGGEQFRYNFYL